MSRVIIQMSMSLDGYIARPDDSPGPLHDWMFSGGGGPGEGITGVDKETLEELRNGTGAMIVGRRVYDITHGWNGSHPFGGLPMFVVTSHVPDFIPSGSTSFTFVTEGIDSAIARAKEAAGDKDVYVVGGASIDQQLLDSGLVDELRIDVVPILLGEGIRLFDKLKTAPLPLEQVKVTPSNQVTHLRFNVSH